jgi:dipeptidyl aminopeptidase/acylaminoacyl peptidase
MRSLNFLLCLLALLSSQSLLAYGESRFCSYEYLRSAVPVSGKLVTIEYYKPAAVGRYPLVFMLHGSSGVFSVDGVSEPATDNFGEKELARQCFAVALPHYMEALGFKSILSVQAMSARFPEMHSVLQQILNGVETLPWIDARQVFLYGESLGGFLGFALAFERSEIIAVSEFSGGIPSGYNLLRRGQLKVLISHGSSDTVVPIAEADKVALFCREHDIPVEMQIFKGQGHFLSPTARQEVVDGTVRFFLRER